MTEARKSSTRSESRTIAHKGRVLGFAEYGDPAGTPVILYSGTPGSRLGGRMFDGWAQKAGCRLVALDRPGFGLSTFQKGRQLMDHAADTGAVCDELGIDRFAVVGVSGGTPYVLACLSALPERVTAGAIVSSFFGLDTLADPAAWSDDQRRHWEEVREDPETTRASYDQARSALPTLDPEQVLGQQVSESPAWIKELAASDPAFARASVDYLLEALRQGSDGGVQEIGLMAHPWGIDLSPIRANIRFWHGGKDQNPRAHIEAYMAALPEASLSWHDDLSHFDCVFLLPQVFEWLMSKAQAEVMTSADHAADG